MLIGKQAPDIRMTTTKDLNSLDRESSLAEYHGRWLVLFFYPADFTFVCPTEVMAFSQAVPAFAELDAEVLDCLRAQFDERSATFGWPCATNYRFEREQTRIMLWSCRGQCDWWISAHTNDALREAVSLILPFARLRECLWSSDAEGVQLLADLGITSP